MLRRALLGLALAAGGAAVAACTSTSTYDHSEGGADSSDDSAEADGSGSVDAPQSETSVKDATVDMTAPPTDAGPDGADATTPDSGLDAAPPEASLDAPVDVAPDALLDAGTDAPADSADGAPAEAGPPPPYCGDGGYLFCDGFENAFMAWSGTYVYFGSIAADSTHVHSGSYAMLSHTNQVYDAGGAYAAQVQLFQSLPSHFFTRFFVYEPSPAPPSTANFLDLDESYSPYGGIAFNTEPPSGGLSFNTFNTSADAKWASDGGAITLDSWVCFEVEVDTVQETSHLYMNGVEVPDVAQTGLDLAQLGIVSLGLTFNQPNPQAGQTVWFDDVAVSATRIGCSN
jgi:hypothetical protein